MPSNSPLVRISLDLVNPDEYELLQQCRNVAGMTGRTFLRALLLMRGKELAEEIAKEDTELPPGFK